MLLAFQAGATVQHQPQRSRQRDEDSGEEDPTQIGARVGVYGLDDAAAGGEGAEEHQREGENRQQVVPRAKAPTFVLHHCAVKQRGGGKPGHQPGVLHRIPGPVAAPAQHIISPAHSQQQPQAQPQPGDEQPGAQWRGPIHLRFHDECCQRKRKRHSQAHVADVHGRRMEDHARMPQQGIEALPIQRGAEQLRKRIGEEQR